MIIRLLRNISHYKENDVVDANLILGKMTIETNRGTCWLNPDEYEIEEFYILIGV